MMKRLALLMVMMGLALGQTGGLAWGDDFYVVAGGGTSGKVLKTQVFTSTSSDTILGTSTWAKLPSPQWTYTKVSPTSYLVITYQDTFNIIAGAINFFSAYQLRVNDQSNVTGGDMIYYGQGGETLVWQPAISYSATAVWTGLPQGDAILSIWHCSSNCNQCKRNMGVGSLNPITRVIVMEIENK